MKPVTHAGIVLCGGHSQRMGMAKAWLPFGEETLLARVVRLLSATVDEVIVVAAVGQALPPLPSSVRVVHDERPDRGPFEGLLAGLTALDEHTTAAYVTGCDAPLLRPAFVQTLFSLLGDEQCAVPHIDGRDQPLSAVYRPEVRTEIAAMLAEDCLRVRSLFDRVATRRVMADELRAVDPPLDSLRGCNTPKEYRTLLAMAKDLSLRDQR